MKNLRFLLSFAVMLTLVCGCYRKDERTIELKIPKLTSAECSQHVLNALTKMEGIKGASPDLANQTLSVTYNARLTASKNVEYAITEAGFDVNDSHGDEKAKEKLPESCR